MNKDVLLLREKIKKLVPMIAGRGLRVTQVGTRAYVKANVKTGIPERVNIPTIPDNAEHSFILAIEGFIDHEVAHVLFTDFKYKAVEKTKELHNLHNIMEDTMIERLQGEKFPGSIKNISQLRRHFVEKVTGPAVLAAKSDEEAFAYLLVVAMRALAGHEEMQQFMDDNGYWEQKLVKALIDRMNPATIKRIPKIRTTQESFEIAKEIYDIMNPPPPPAPPAPEPKEQEEDDSQSDEKGDNDDSQSKDPGEDQSDADEGDGGQSQEDEDQNDDSPQSEDEGQSGDQEDDTKPDDAADGETGDGEDDEDHSDEEQAGDDGEGDGEREHDEDKSSDNASGGDEESDEEQDDEETGNGSAGADGEEPGEEGQAGESEQDPDGDEDSSAGGSDDTEEGSDDEDSSEDDGEGSSGQSSEEESDGSEGADDEADEDQSSQESGADQERDGDEGDESDGDAQAGADAPGDAGSDEKDGDDAGEEDEDEGPSKEELQDALNNVAVELDDDQDDENDHGAADNDSEDDGLEVAGVGYQGPNPFEHVEIDLDQKDLSSSIAILIQRDVIEAMNEADYTVYTREYDVIEPLEVPKVWDTDPKKNAQMEEEFHKQLLDLDEQTSKMTGVMQKDIERMMAAQSRTFNYGGRRSGRLNGPGLHRLVAGDPRVFTQREEIRSKNTAVTLLNDCSGSMRGLKQSIAMAASYAFTQVLERVNIPCEVMGFTTGGNRWARSLIGPCAKKRDRMIGDLYAEWAEEERKTGLSFSRVDPIYMPIFKEFSERLNAEVKRRFAFQRSYQPNQQANIDGESLEYAAMRLAQRSEQRKVIFVLSDGFPAGAHGDDEHLRMMTTKLTNAGFDLVGIGICSDAVERFYDNNLVLHSVEELPAAVMGKLRQILQK